MDTLDLFCGAGGWGDHYGIDSDQDVGQTRAAAGLQTSVADVGAVPMSVIKSTFEGIVGMVASPPCPPFSTAGSRAGAEDMDNILAAVTTQGYGMDTRRAYGDQCVDARSMLSAEPLRWTMALRPEWTAWEQVVGALPIFTAAGRILADNEYSVWVGILDAHDYGVPQNRRRVILMAHRKRMVSMPPRVVPSLVMRQVVEGAHTDALLCMGRSRGTKRTLDEPAPTIMFGKSPNDVGWYTPHSFVQLAPLSLREALILQTFSPDYPLRGSKESKYRQVGDSIPRSLASAILSALTS